MKKASLICILGLLFFVKSASAHGGEDKEGLTNLQIMLISLAACFVIYLISEKLFSTGLKSNNKIFLSLVTYTGTVHVLLGVNDILLLFGGISVLLLLIVAHATNIGRENYGVLQIILGVAIVSMFVAYFVSNHDLHYIAEDFLGITTKLAELGVIALIIRQNNKQSQSKNTQSND